MQEMDKELEYASDDRFLLEYMVMDEFDLDPNEEGSWDETQAILDERDHMRQIRSDYYRSVI